MTWHGLPGDQSAGQIPHAPLRASLPQRDVGAQIHPIDEVGVFDSAQALPEKPVTADPVAVTPSPATLEQNLGMAAARSRRGADREGLGAARHAAAFSGCRMMWSRRTMPLMTRPAKIESTSNRPRRPAYQAASPAQKLSEKALPER
jgi:hypothetical protein